MRFSVGASVSLIAGPSSVGKSTVAAEIAIGRGAEIVHVDDLAKRSNDPAVAAERASDVWARSPGELKAMLVQRGEGLGPAIVTAIRRGLAGAHPVAIEGEGIHPSLVARFATEGVRAAFVVEADGARIHRTLWSRSQSFRELPQEHRANVVGMNLLYGAWLREECERLRHIWLSSWPWNTLSERVAAALARPLPNAPSSFR
jgi:hypothetical protein